MKDKTLLKGLRTRATYDKLAGYLDGGQETLKYPDRLATQLQNSYQISNLVDSEGKGWFQENKEQMRNFTEQPVKDILIKANLESGQTYQQEKILRQGGATPKKQRPDRQRGGARGSEQPKSSSSEEGFVKGAVKDVGKDVVKQVGQAGASFIAKKIIEKGPELLARMGGAL